MLGRSIILIVFGFSVYLANRSHGFAPDESGRSNPPNVLIILADDLGYSDLGCYGGEIETPNLDNLAKGGQRFSQFYNTGRCWPTRASLLTGYYPHQIGFDLVPGDPPLRRHPRPTWAPLISERLRGAGYRSYHSGKWHLDTQPVKSGFDHSYSLDDHGRYFSPKNHSLDGQKLPEVERDSGYYATTRIADRMIEFLQEHKAQHPDAPFFGYLAFTAPHFPLHALAEDIRKYEARYLTGWNQLRRDRWDRIREMGLVNGELSDVEPEIRPPYDRPDDLKLLGENEVNQALPWEQLTEGQREFQARKMAIHAAMVDRMDLEVGRVLAQIREMEAWENTIILFLSDNGASAEIMVRDDGHDPAAPMGSAASHLCLGPGFAALANTPFRRHKTWVHEGGIRTPFIVHWPTGGAAADTINRTVGHVIDITPTILAVAGIEAQSIEGMPAISGHSLAASLRGEQSTEERVLWWCHEGNEALRAGDFKVVHAKSETWQLYDLAADPTERENLAGTKPNITDSLVQVWQQHWETFRRDNALYEAPQPNSK